MRRPSKPHLDSPSGKSIDATGGLCRGLAERSFVIAPAGPLAGREHANLGGHRGASGAVADDDDDVGGGARSHSAALGGSRRS